MKRSQHVLPLILAGGLLAGSSCAGCGPTPGSGTTGSSGTPGNTESSSSSGLAGGSSGLSGSGSSGMAGGSSSSSGDAGSPLEQPRDAFCMGSGAVVDIGGGTGSICSGDLAEETFRFALCACDNISVGSQLTVDAFDSSLGGYGAAIEGGATNIQSDGQLGINGGPLTLANKLTVRGSVFVGGGGIQTGPDSLVEGTLYAYGDATQATNTALTVERNAFIHGDVAQRYTIEGNLTVPPGATVNGTVTGTTTQADFAQQLPCPCGPDQVLDVGELTAWAATNNDNGALDGGLFATQWENGGPSSVDLPCGRYYVTRITPGSSLTINALGRVALFVDGDLTVSGITINVAEGAELDLFVKGSVSITSAASFGSADTPSKVRVYVGGNLSLQASSVFAGNVYAPNADVAFGASANVYGALFVNTVSFSGSAGVHFDSAIRRAGEACVPPAVDGGMPDAADAGVVDPGDAGIVDAGTPDASTADAGPAACTDRCTNTCGELACVIPSGQTGGTCGACLSDLDCCSPEICDPSNGQCVLFVGG